MLIFCPAIYHSMDCFKRSKLFFQISKNLAPKSWKLNLIILKDVTWAFKLNLIFLQTNTPNTPQTAIQYSTIVTIVYDNECHRTIPQYTVNYSVVHNNVSTTRNVTFLFRVLQLYCCTTGNDTFLFMALKLYWCTRGNVTFLFMVLNLYLKKNQSTPRPSEHPSVMGGEMSKCLGEIKGCKYKISSWHLNRFPDADNIGSTV